MEAVAGGGALFNMPKKVDDDFKSSSFRWGKVKSLFLRPRFCLKVQQNPPPSLTLLETTYQIFSPTYKM